MTIAAIAAYHDKKHIVKREIWLANLSAGEEILTDVDSHKGNIVYGIAS